MKLLVDYAGHPAFRGLVPQGERSLPEARSYFDALDNAWRIALAPSASGSPQDELQRFDIVQAAEEHKLVGALATWIGADYLPYVKEALRISAGAIRREIGQIHAARRKSLTTGHVVSSIRQSLADKGVAGFQMSAAALAQLNAALSPFRDELREQRRSNGGARCFVVPPSKGEHWQIMKSFLREQRIEEAISAYAGYPLELEGYAFTYSHADETWYRKCYLDIPLAAPRTVQMHYDEDNLSAKSMFYLNDVGENNGAFSYLAIGRAEISSRSQLAYFKYLDYANNEFAAARGVPVTSYNRPLFITPPLRKEFARLPAEMQGSGGPGDDIQDGTALSDFLIAHERRLVGPAGYLALFAGGETLHRGGVVESGERFALQMIYKSPPSTAQKAARRLRSLRGFLPRVVNRLRGS
jgi:hypothetical protein